LKEVWIDDSGQTVIEKPEFMKKWVVVHRETNYEMNEEKIWVSRVYD